MTSSGNDDRLFQATYDPSHGYSPQPIDITHMALSRDLQVGQLKINTTDLISHILVNIPHVQCLQSMAEQLAENYHNTWGRKKKMELQSKGIYVYHFFLT